MTEQLEIIGVENKCEASCPNRATTTLRIKDQDFEFCERCAARLRDATEMYNAEVESLV